MMLPFRRGLIVLVVGEDPTGGIHAEQFKHSLAWIDKLRELDSKSPMRVAILGPTFSGSFASLGKLLASDDSQNHWKRIHGDPSVSLAIYSGTANSGRAISSFYQASKSDSKLKPLKIDFRNFLEWDEVGLDRYCNLLLDQSTNPNVATGIAVISEDETAYGGESGNEPGTCLGKALWLYYPRDISSLRAAYQTNSIFTVAGAQQSSDVPRSRLPTNLADPEGKKRDSIPSYGGSQTPIAQEAFLLGIANALRVHHSQYVMLRSTNVLDQIFLARYLRRAYPDARIVTDGSDRLFEREPTSMGMEGTLSLSTYPLLEREPGWIGNDLFSGQRLFNSDTSEGTYIAFRLLLHSQGLSEDSAADPCRLQDGEAGLLPALPPNCKQPAIQVPIPDYGVPSWLADTDAARRPPTWLSVLGRDGYWAVAAINEKTLQPATGKNSSSTGNYEFEAPLSLMCWLIFLAGFTSFHMWCCGRASFTAKPAFRTHFANPGDWRHTVLVFLGSMFLALLPLIVGWGCGLLFGLSSRISNPGLIRAVILLECLIAGTASVVNIVRVEQLNRGDGLNWRARLMKRWKALLLVCGGFAFGTMLFLRLFAEPMRRFQVPANRVFAEYRNAHLLSGVSPIVPLLALALGSYLWFWHSLHGLALFGSDRCALPLESDLLISIPDDKTQSDQAARNKTEDDKSETDKAQTEKVQKCDLLPMFSQQAAQGTEVGAKPLSLGAIILAVLLFVALLVVVKIVSRGWPVRSLGADYYAQFFLWCLLACFSLMLTEAWRLLRTWVKLRELLVYLDRLALRRTLAALRGFSWGSVWGISGNVLDVRYKLLSRQLESLGHTHSALNEEVNSPCPKNRSSRAELKAMSRTSSIV